MKELSIGDFELLRGINNRDGRIINKFHGVVYAKLFWFAHKFMNNAFDAEEIVNDAFLAFLRTDIVFDSLAFAEGWLYNRIRWICLDKLKSKAIDNKRITSAEPPENVAYEESVEDLIVKAEVYNAIKVEIEKYPKRDQQIIRLYFFEGKNSPEIAHILNVKVSYVYNKKDRLLKSIKVILIRKKLIVIVLSFFSPN